MSWTNLLSRERHAMIPATLLALLISQGPGGDGNWLDGGDVRARGSIRVIGDVQLTEVEADESARSRAVAEYRDRLEHRGAEAIARQKRSWLPSFVASLILEEWIGGQVCEDGIRVLERRVMQRDHGFGKSYQTTLFIEEDAEITRDTMAVLRERMEHAMDRFLYKCGGSVLLWGALGLAYLWLDRLTRGYMMWRLRVVLGGIGVAVPGIAFLMT
jgi:hypothetical protein